MDAKTGIIPTMTGDYAADQANDGLGGFSGNGGPATSAQLNDPQGVAVDGQQRDRTARRRRPASDARRYHRRERHDD